VYGRSDPEVDVTEGTRAGPIVNWERCRYEWSTPGSVKALVTDSNVYDPAASYWEIKATPNGADDLLTERRREREAEERKAQRRGVGRSR
jgi:hypothetical protein